MDRPRTPTGVLDEIVFVIHGASGAARAASLARAMDRFTAEGGTWIEDPEGGGHGLPVYVVIGDAPSTASVRGAASYARHELASAIVEAGGTLADRTTVTITCSPAIGRRRPPG